MKGFREIIFRLLLLDLVLVLVLWSQVHGVLLSALRLRRSKRAFSASVCFVCSSSLFTSSTTRLRRVLADLTHYSIIIDTNYKLINISSIISSWNALLMHTFSDLRAIKKWLESIFTKLVVFLRELLFDSLYDSRRNFYDHEVCIKHAGNVEQRSRLFSRRTTLIISSICVHDRICVRGIKLF